MFHSGEVIGYKGPDDDEWTDLTVVTGYCDWPVKRMVFATKPGDPPWRIERHHPPGVLAVLRRQSDGVRFLLEDDTWQLQEQSEGRLQHFDRHREDNVRSQFEDATGGGGTPVARRVISQGGRTLREPTVGD